MNKWSQERENELKALVAQGLTTSQIGRAIGLSRRAVTAKIARMGIQGPSKTPSLWTEERTETLRTLWAEGYSAAQVARRMGCGFTRNGIIGKVARLKLEGRSQVGKNASAKINARVARGLTRKREPIPRPVIVSAFVPRRGPVAFLERPLDRCAWFEGDPKAAPIGRLMCCGETVRPGSSYCPDHHTVCFYRPLKQAKIARGDKGDVIEFGFRGRANGGILRT